MDVRWLCRALVAFLCFCCLSLASQALQLATVQAEVKISDTEGGFQGILADDDVFGRSVAALGDLDGDGIGDIAVGANGDSENGPNRGAIWILFLNADGTVKAEQKINGTHGGFGGVLVDGDRFGRSLALLGDLNGDGRSELAVGAHLDDDGGAFQDRGAVWILFLNSDGTVAAETKISHLAGGFDGSLSIGDQFGFSAAALGDLDADGVPDLAVGSDHDDDGGGGADINVGAIWILFLNADGTVKSEQKISNTQGGFTGAADLADRGVGLGANALANIGDLDGDGVVDLVSSELKGARALDTLWVLFLRRNGTIKGYSRIASGIGGFPDILHTRDAFGRSIAAVGNLNCDGLQELAVGASGADDGGSDRGAIWLLSLNSAGTVVASSKISQTAGGFHGTLEDGDQFGSAVAAFGDHDGNGTPDLLVGAHLADDGGNRRGSAWALFLHNDEQPPSFTSATCGSTLSTNVGQELVFQVSASDPDPGDQLVLEATGLPPSADLLPSLPAFGATPSAVVRWTPQSSDIGTHFATFLVTDSAGCTATCSVALQVVSDMCNSPELHRREPGSLLLYPEFQNGPGRVTLLTVTNANCGVLEGDVEIEFRYINGDSCLKHDQSAHLTPCDTLTLLTNSHTGDDHGYVYLYAKTLLNTDANANGEPISFNHLVGQVTVVDSWQALDYSVNAVSFQALGREGASTDLDEDGVRDLDGAEYAPAPDKLLIPRFLGSDLLPNVSHASELLLIALSGGSSFVETPVNPTGGTVVDFLIYNDNEQVFSAEHRFDCWEKVYLQEISGIFLNDNLKLLTDHAADEVLGASERESGWMVLDGSVANSVADSIQDPAIYAVLIERVHGTAAADLPFEYCSQFNGDLLPAGIFGDGPNPVAGDDQ